MSNTCATGTNPGGKNKNCSSIKKKIVNFCIQLPEDPNFSPVSGGALDDINDVSNWEKRFNSGAMYRFTLFSGDAEKVGGDAVTRQNSSNGATSVMRFNAQGFNAYIETNECDYNEMKKVFVPGRSFKVWEETQEGIEGWEFDNGGVMENRGYTAEVVANPNNSAVADENTDFMVMINYKYAVEKEYSTVIEKPDFFEMKAEAAIPLGYSLKKIDTSTITAAIVRLTEKCGDVVTGVDGTAFFADGSALLTGDVTDNADGTYTLDLTGVSNLQVVEGTVPDISSRSNLLSI